MDPNEEGPCENGCHHWLADSVSLTIETDSKFNRQMQMCFAWVQRETNLEATRSKVDQDEVMKLFRGFMKKQSQDLLQRALDELIRCSDADEVPEMRAEYKTEEVKQDLQNWLYRRYKIWNQENN